MSVELESRECTQLVGRWRRQRMWAAFRRTFWRPHHLGWLALVIPAVSISIIAGSYGIAAWTAVTGTVVSAVLVAADTTRSVARDAPRPIRMRPAGVLSDGVLPEDLGSHQLRALYLAILRSHERLAQAIGDDALSAGLQDVRRGADELVAEAGVLALDADYLEDQLDRLDSSAVCRQRAADLEKRAEATSNVDACTTYLRAAALSHRSDELRRDIRGSLEQLHARMNAIESWLGLTCARIVRLRAPSAQLRALPSAEPTASLPVDLSGLDQELALVETSLFEATVGAVD